MVIIGYPGVGKSTVSKGNYEFIDYDSSRYTKEPGWEEKYVKDILNYSKMGYIVFVSSHKRVQELLRLSKEEEIIVVYPSLQLREFWIDKLEERYKKTEDAGDYRALKRCVSNYCEDILEMRALPFKKIEITEKDYDLESLLRKVC